MKHKCTHFPPEKGQRPGLLGLDGVVQLALELVRVHPGRGLGNVGEGVGGDQLDVREVRSGVLACIDLLVCF